VVLVLAGCPSTPGPAGGLDPAFVDPRAHEHLELDRVGHLVEGDCIGRTVAPAGDQDGDGFDGFLLAAGDCWQPGSEEGVVYLFDGPIDDDFGPSDAEARFFGSGDPGPLGVALDAGADLDGDGIPDLAAGLSADYLDGDERGGVVLYAGPLAGDYDDEHAFARITGTRDLQHVGYALATGDFDGDGADDLAVGAPRSTVGGVAWMGEVLVFHGPLQGDLDADQADARIRRAKVPGAGWLGHRLVNAGDVDGDGTDDLAVSGAGGPAGRVHLLRGPLSGLRSLEEAELVLRGEREDALGRGLSAGDLDGDGIPDLVAGAPGAGEPEYPVWGDGEGAVFVASGGTEGSVGAASLPTALAGETEWDRAGDSVAVVGDVDGDGLPDLLVGGPRARHGTGVLEGAAWLVLGPVEGVADLAWADVRIDGHSQAGRLVAPAGDVDGDGLADVLITSGGGLAWLVPGAALVPP